MRSATFFYIIVTLIVAIAAANFLALSIGLYFRWVWFDIPMHFLGGLWVGLFSAWIARFSGILPRLKAWPISLVTLGGTLAFGLLWEGYEFAIGAIYAPFLGDMLLDLVMDMCGGFTAWVIAAKVHEDTPATE